MARPRRGAPTTAPASKVVITVPADLAVGLDDDAGDGPGHRHQPPAPEGRVGAAVDVEAGEGAGPGLDDLFGVAGRVRAGVEGGGVPPAGANLRDQRAAAAE